MLCTKHVHQRALVMFLRDCLDKDVCTLNSMLMPHLNTDMLLQALSLRILPNV